MHTFLGKIGYIDGSLSTARFMNPLGLAIDSYHGVMIVGDSFSTATSSIKNGVRIYTDTFAYSLRRISLRSNNVTTLAGKTGTLNLLCIPYGHFAFHISCMNLM